MKNLKLIVTRRDGLVTGASIVGEAQEEHSIGQYFEVCTMTQGGTKIMQALVDCFNAAYPEGL